MFLLLMAVHPAAAATGDTQDVELADAPTIAVDWNNGRVQYVTLGGSRTFTFSNGQDSGRYVLVITQDTTGSRSVTWPASVRWPGIRPPALTTTANKTDYVTFIFNRRSHTYDGVGISQNY